jgi:hypothetical protein
MTKKELIQKTSFGESIAEFEAEKLKNYFLQTEFWNAIRNGGNDIVYGAKGAGKSALYTSLTNDAIKLFDENILLALAENPTGSTAFSNLTNDPPTSELEFVRLWKLYFLVITVSVLDEYTINDNDSKRVKEILRDCDLIPAQNRLSSFLKACFDFLKSFRYGKEVSTTAEFDSVTGMYSGQKFSLSFGEPSKSDFEKGLIPIEHVYELLQKSLTRNGIKLWITIDRLDVAFLDSEELEANALRALFKAYLDLSKFTAIKIKIFLRDDIWRKIVSEGFREASHITKFQNLTWTRESLLNLLIRRILDNPDLVAHFNIDKDLVMSDMSKQEELFYILFPDQIDVGSRKSKTMEWVLSRTKDGKGINTPRELIQLFSHARTIELKKQDTGINELTEENILSRQSIKEAIAAVSKQRVEQTIYAEYPSLKGHMEALRGDKAEHTFETLALKWGVSVEDAVKIAKELENIGFFEPRGDLRSQRYRIPFLYRPYLDIIQGAATLDED